MTMAIPGLRAGLTDAIPAHLRGTGFGAFNLVAVVFGRPPRPFIVGALSAAFDENLRVAFLAVTPFSFLGAAVLFRARKFLDEDMNKIMMAVLRPSRTSRTGPRRRPLSRAKARCRRGDRPLTGSDRQNRRLPVTDDSGCPARLGHTGSSEQRVKVATSVRRVPPTSKGTYRWTVPMVASGPGTAARTGYPMLPSSFRQQTLISYAVRSRYTITAHLRIVHAVHRAVVGTVVAADATSFSSEDEHAATTSAAAVVMVSAQEVLWWVRMRVTLRQAGSRMAGQPGSTTLPVTS